MIDPLTRRVVYNGRELDLPRREFDLLYVLSSQVESISGYLRDWESVDFDDKRRVLGHACFTSADHKRASRDILETLIFSHFAL